LCTSSVNDRKEAYTDSIEAFCKRVLKTSSDQKTVNFIRAIENYGNAVAVSAGYEKDIAKVDESQFEDITVESFKEYKPVVKQNAGGIRYRGTSLAVTQDTSILFTFLLEKGAKSTDYIIKLNGKEITPEVEGSYIDIATAGLSSRQLAEEQVVEITEKATGKTTTVKYSAMGYASDLMNAKNMSKASRNIAKALYNYNKYSQEYFAK
jgi:DNA-binding TFAR19-related protein (PDSD5 family)